MSARSARRKPSRTASSADDGRPVVITQQAIDAAQAQAISVIVAMKKTGFHPVIVRSHQSMQVRAFDLLRLMLLEQDIDDVEPMRGAVEAAAKSVVHRLESSNAMLPEHQRLSG